MCFQPQFFTCFEGGLTVKSAEKALGFSLGKEDGKLVYVDTVSNKILKDLGVRKGLLVVAINGIEIKSLQQAQNLLKSTNPPMKVQFTQVTCY